MIELPDRAIRDALRSALRWLSDISTVGLAPRMPRQRKVVSDVTHITWSLQAAIATMICGDETGMEVRNCIARLVEIPASAGLARLADINGPLVLLCCLGVGRVLKSMPAALESFVRESAAVARRLASPNGAYSAARALLARLGSPVESPIPTTTRPDPYALLLRKRERSLIAALDSVETMTAFGTRRIPAHPELEAAVDGVVLERLREYDLDIACRALRAREYLNPAPCLIKKTGRDFLLANQCADGSFGHFDSEVKALKTRRTPHDAALSFKVPTTLACVWTLSELNADYRVFRDIGLKA